MTSEDLAPSGGRGHKGTRGAHQLKSPTVSRFAGIEAIVPKGSRVPMELGICAQEEVRIGRQSGVKVLESGAFSLCRALSFR